MALVERRAQLGLTQQEFADRADIDIKVVQRLEGGKVTRPRAVTLGGIDRAAEWPPGYARRLRDGKIYVDEPEPPAAQPSPEDRAAELLREAYTRAGVSPAEFMAIVARVAADLEREAATDRGRVEEAG